jgi:hypothetical protein
MNPLSPPRHQTQPMTSDAEKLFDEIDALQVKLRGLREVKKDLLEKLNELALEIGEVRLQLVAKNDRFQQVTESAAVIGPRPGSDPHAHTGPVSRAGTFSLTPLIERGRERLPEIERLLAPLLGDRQ